MQASSEHVFYSDVQGTDTGAKLYRAGQDCDAARSSFPPPGAPSRRNRPEAGLCGFSGAPSGALRVLGVLLDGAVKPAAPIAR